MSIECLNCGYMNHARGGRIARFCAQCGQLLRNEAAIHGQPAPVMEELDDEHLSHHSAPDGLAIIAMMMGLLGFLVPLVPYAAMVLGMLSHIRIKKSCGKLTGQTMATVGVLCGLAAWFIHLGLCCIIYQAQSSGS